MTTDEQQAPKFGIGVAERRSGVSAALIRMWEKRYRAVTPTRTESNRRLYSEGQIARLTKLRRLVDRGYSISRIATLGDDELARQLEEVGAVSAQSADAAETKRLISVGHSLEVSLSPREFPQMTRVAHFNELGEALASDRVPEADLLVVELQTLFPEQVDELRRLFTRCGASRGVLLYRFTRSATVAETAMKIAGLTVMRGPLGDSPLRRECRLQFEAEDEPTVDSIDGEQVLPERRFSPQQLAQLSRISSSVNCECPQHLASLLQDLSAFERYSGECEDRSPDDARLHRFLHRTTAEVRRRMEDALHQVIEAEGITLD